MVAITPLQDWVKNMGKKEGNNFNSVKPVKFLTTKSGEPAGWSQTIKRIVPEQSPNWQARKNGRFKKDEVYPCNEGFPGVVRIGPIEGGWPIMFDVILCDGTKSEAMVSPKKLEGVNAWLLVDSKNKQSKLVSYYKVAGWASTGFDRTDYDFFERMVMWLIRHWPGR